VSLPPLATWLALKRLGSSSLELMPLTYRFKDIDAGLLYGCETGAIDPEETEGMMLTRWAGGMLAPLLFSSGDEIPEILSLISLSMVSLIIIAEQ
jgi:hypothetical protein